MAKLSENTTIDGKTIFEMVHPVGSIFQTTNGEINPADLCNENTTWELIKGRFLFSVDPDDEAHEKPCVIGGEETHKLTVDEIPSHMHNLIRSDGASVGSWQTNASGGSLWWMPADGDIADHKGYYTTNTGGSKEHNNMPPYYTVYTWHRVA